MSRELVAATEAELQSAVIEMMQWQGWLCYHTHDSRRSNPGYPDLTAVRESRVVFVEFKSEKGKIRAEQITWLDALVSASAEVYLVRPSTMDDFLKDVTISGTSLKTHWRNVRD